MRAFTFCLLSACLAQAQVRVSAPNVDLSSNLPAQKMGPRDLIVLQVYDSPELTRTVRIDSDGMVRLPMMKQRIKAEGLMPNELETAVATALAEEGLIVEPFVTITVAEYAS